MSSWISSINQTQLTNIWKVEYYHDTVITVRGKKLNEKNLFQ